MVQPIRFWSGDEWQRYILQLLKRHYQLGEFQEIPDRHLGDCGLARISHQVEWPAVLMPGWHRCEARERLAHSYASTFLAAIEKQGKNQRWGRFSPRFARGFSAETPRELRWPSPASVQQRLGTHVGRMASKFWYTCRNTPS